MAHGHYPIDRPKYSVDSYQSVIFNLPMATDHIKHSARQRAILKGVCRGFRTAMRDLELKEEKELVAKEFKTINENPLMVKALTEVKTFEVRHRLNVSNLYYRMTISGSIYPNFIKLERKDISEFYRQTPIQEIRNLPSQLRENFTTRNRRSIGIIAKLAIAMGLFFFIYTVVNGLDLLVSYSLVFSILALTLGPLALNSVSSASKEHKESTVRIINTLRRTLGTSFVKESELFSDEKNLAEVRLLIRTHAFLSSNHYVDDTPALLQWAIAAPPAVTTSSSSSSSSTSGDTATPLGLRRR